MAIAAPLAFAGAGGAAAFALGGPVGAGVAAGWLVGSWLFAPQAKDKNDVLDTKAEGLPEINSALRGTTIPVLYGTNRVPAQIVGRNRFRTFRHETKGSQGGGKAGGSGMGGKAQAQGGGGVSYTYKLDLFYHLGLVPNDQRFSLIGGWVGAERMANATVAGIQNSTMIEGFADDSQGAGLTFDDAWFQGGTDVGSPWSTLTSLTNGQPVRWPYTAWVGFDQLLLGSSPRVPELTFEVGPTTPAYTTTNTSYTGHVAVTSITARWAAGSRPVDINGAIYQGNPVGDRSWHVTNSAGVTVASLSDGFVREAINAFLPNVTVASHGSSNLRMAAPIGDGSRILLWFYDGNDSDTWFATARPITSQSVEILGAVRIDANVGLYEAAFVDMMGLKSFDDGIIIETIGSNNDDPLLFLLPSINQIESDAFATFGEKPPVFNSSGTPTYVTTIYEVTRRIITLPATQNDNFSNDDYPSGSLGNLVHRGGATLPYLDDSGLIPTIGTRLWRYFGRRTGYHSTTGTPDMTAWMASNSVQDGVWAYIDITSFPTAASTSNLGSLQSAGYQVGNSFLKDRDGNVTGPWSEDGRLVTDPTVINSFSYYTPHVSARYLEDEGAWVVSFTQVTAASLDTANHTVNRYRSRVYAYNLVSGQFVLQQNMQLVGPTAAQVIGTNSSDHGHSFAMGWYEPVEPANFTVIGGRYSGANSPGGMWRAGLATLDFASSARDVTPPEIIRDILISPTHGLGYGTENIDGDSYGLAVAYCQANNYVVSTQYRREENANKIIELLLASYGGYLAMSGNKFKFGIQRYSSSVVRTISNDRLVVGKSGEPPVTVTEGALQDTVNYVKVNYLDRALQYRQNFVEIGDEVDQDLNGVRPMEFPPQFVMSERMASKIAERTLWANLYAKSRYDFKLGWKDADLEPGDVVWLVDSIHPALSSGVQCRIVRWKEEKPGLFAISAVEENPIVDEPTGWEHNQTQASSSPMLNVPLPPQAFDMYELPAEYQGANSYLYVGWAAGGTNTAGAKLYLSLDGVSYAQAMDVTPWPVHGQLTKALPATLDVVHDAEFYVLTTSGFNANDPEFTENIQIDDVLESARASGAGAIWCGSEMLCYENLTLLGQNHYRAKRLFRGWGGTHVHSHEAGALFWRHAGGIFAQAYNRDRIGTGIYYKVVPYNFAGIEYAVSSIEGKFYTIRGQYYRPQIAPTPHIWANSEDMRGTFRVDILSGSPIGWTWGDAARVSGFGVGGFGVGGFGQFASDTTSYTARVEIVGSGNVVVRSTVVTTWAYEYPNSQNVADNGAWRGAITLKVTPFNVYGDAARTQEVVMRAFRRT